MQLLTKDMQIYIRIKDHTWLQKGKGKELFRVVPNCMVDKLSRRFGIARRDLKKFKIKIK